MPFVLNGVGRTMSSNAPAVVNVYDMMKEDMAIASVETQRLTSVYINNDCLGVFMKAILPAFHCSLLCKIQLSDTIIHADYTSGKNYSRKDK